MLELCYEPDPAFELQAAGSHIVTLLWYLCFVEVLKVGLGQDALVVLNFDLLVNGLSEGLGFCYRWPRNMNNVQIIYEFEYVE